VDQKSNTIRGIELGESIVSIGGYQVIVRVLKVIMREKIVT